MEFNDASAPEIALSNAQVKFLDAIVSWWVYEFDIKISQKACLNERWSGFAATMSLIQDIDGRDRSLAEALLYRAEAPPVERAHAWLRDWLATHPAYHQFGEVGHLTYPSEMGPSEIGPSEMGPSS
jgi:hypothetical protein